MRNMMMAVAAAGLTVPAATLTVAAPAEAQRYYNSKTWYDGQGRLRCKRNNGSGKYRKGQPYLLPDGQHPDLFEKIEC